MADVTEINTDCKTASPATPENKKISLVVLPFQNLSGDAEQDYFADGLTEDLLSGLARLSGLQVIARHTSFTYKSDEDPLAQVARDLNLDYALQGSVRCDGNRVRISARLIGLRHGQIDWADNFDGHLEDIFDLQDIITSKIVSSLSMQLTMEDQTRLINRYTRSVEARELFMRARIRYRIPGPQANAEAMRWLDEALALDPDMGWAYAIRAFVRFHAWFFGWQVTTDALSVALNDARRAVTLDPGLAAGHSYLGWLMIWQQKNRSTLEKQDIYEQALAAHRKAIGIDPNYAEGYIWYASTLIYAGQPENATEPMRKALELDPRYPTFYRVNFANQAIHLGDYAEAERQLAIIEQRSPDFPLTYVFQAIARAMAGNISGARKAAEATVSRMPGTNATKIGERLPYLDQGHWSRVVKALREAGL